MRVLVTGGTGFIGSQVVNRLLEETGWEVVVVDGLTYAGDMERLLGLGIDSTQVPVYWHDLRSPIPEYLDRKLGQIDAVINCAAGTSVDRSITEPREFFLNNTASVLTMLDWARTRGNDVSHFLQVSTDEVYGPAPPGFFHREWDVALPSNPYAASKAAQESAAIAYWRTFGVPVVIGNTMNNIGPRQHPEKFVPMVISKLRAGHPMTVHARPSADGLWEASSRVWLHAATHADALVFLLRRQVALYPAFDRPDRWNVVGDAEVDCLRMVEMIAAHMGVEPLVTFVDYHTQRPGHDHRYALDGSKLREAGWNPPQTFEESLADTVDWYLAHPNWLAQF